MLCFLIVMTHKPVILDECCSQQIARYLEEMGEEVIVIDDGRSDSNIRRLGHKLDAYIITKDNGFMNYRKAIKIGRDNPERVYEKLMAMKSSEK